MDPREDTPSRGDWTAEIVELGADKTGLYDSLSPSERLHALAALNAHVWGEVPRSDRSEWPVEVFELHPDR